MRGNLERGKAFFNLARAKWVVTPVIANAKASDQRVRELNYPFSGGQLLKKPPHPIPPTG